MKRLKTYRDRNAIRITGCSWCHSHHCLLGIPQLMLPVFRLLSSSALLQLLFIIFVCLAGPFACNKEIEPIDVDAAIEEEMDALGIPSVVACIVDKSGILWTGTYGHANREYNIPATEETIYPLESITKVFISLTVFQLWEQGLIELDADVNDYLPYSVRNPYYPDTPITVAMLLNHCSGLAWPKDEEPIPDFNHFYIDEEPTPVGEWVPEYILPAGSQYRDIVWKDFPPGSTFLYSNIGASLVAVIVEEISGMDFREYCREQIFEPLGMTSTTFYLSELDYEKIATPYSRENSPMWYFSMRHYPAGFLNSNLVDFARFVQAILQRGELDGVRILERETFNTMLEVQNLQTGAANLWDTYTGDAFGHIGGGIGFATVVEWQPEHGYAFFILTNRENSDVYHKGRIYELVKYQAVNGEVN